MRVKSGRMMPLPLLPHHGPPFHGVWLSAKDTALPFRHPFTLFSLTLALTASGAFAAKSITVDLSKSTAYTFDEGRLVRALVINPGGKGTPTHPGSYRISQKVRSGYRSNLVDIHNQPMRKGSLGAPMDFWMRIGSTGMGFHRSSMWRPSGRWGSHGCLRMSRAGARWLFGWAGIGTPVRIVSHGTQMASAVGGESKLLKTASGRPGKPGTETVASAPAPVLPSQYRAVAAKSKVKRTQPTLKPKPIPAATVAVPTPPATPPASAPATPPASAPATPPAPVPATRPTDPQPGDSTPPLFIEDEEPAVSPVHVSPAQPVQPPK